MAKRTELAVPDDNGKGEYAILKSTPQELQELLQGVDAELTQFSLDRVRVPTGGATTWTVPTIRGEQSTKELTGVILYIKPARAFWKASFDETGGGTPPDCSSEDLLTGTGDPGGLCHTCPWNQWGSLAQLSPAREGSQGKACRETRLLFILQPQRRIPLLVVVPPSSLSHKYPGTVSKYLLGLASEGLAPFAVETSLSLHQERMGKFPVGVIQARVTRELEPGEVVRFREIAHQFRPVLEHATIVQEDVDGEEA